MYVVIPVAAEPRNPSLPYAIASIRKHTTYTPVTVGHDHGICYHIPAIQTLGRANIFRNTDNHMRTAIRELGEPFIWSADDIYWLRPAEPIRWAIGDLNHATGNTVYTQRKRHTAATLHALGYPQWDYEAHVPMLVDPEPMLEALALTDADPMLDKRSLYGNLTGTPDITAPDVKVRSRRDPLPDASWASSEGTPEKWPALMAALT